jgi:hypothetical protein
MANNQPVNFIHFISNAVDNQKISINTCAFVFGTIYYFGLIVVKQADKNSCQLVIVYNCF